MTKLQILLICSLSLLLTSCFKEDERVYPYVPGDVEIATIVMMEDYRYQSFFSFKENKVIDSVNKYSWHLALSCAEDDYTLHPNTSLFMKVAHTSSYNFDSTYTVIDNLEWKFDSSDGDSTGYAIGKWWLSIDSTLLNKGEVFLIDKGIDDEGLPLGYLKIQPGFNQDTQQVEIKIAELNGSNERTFSFIKDPVRAFVTMSFETGQNEKQPYPATDSWDLMFTQYTTLLYTDEGEAYPYLVTGALINQATILSTLDTTIAFNEVTREFAETLDLTDRLDIIGYDWKEINGDVTSGDITYTARANYIYIIRTSEGYYYKLRFVDFYNETGLKGYPKFEYQRL